MSLKCVLSVFILSLFMAAPVSAQVTSLPDLLEATKRHHPQLRAQRAELRGTREVVNEARAAYRPNVFADASIRTSRRDATLQGGGDFEQNLSPQSTSLRLTQTLYNGGRRYLQAYGATISVKSAEARYKASAFSAQTEVQQDYIALSSVQQRITLLTENVTILRELKKATETRLSYGDSSRIDTAQVESRLAGSEATLAAARSEQNIIRARLEQATGITVLEAVLPPPPLDLSSMTLELASKAVRSNSSVLQASKLDEQSAGILLESQSRSGLPTIELNAAAVASRNNSPTIDNDNQINIGVRLTLPLYSGGTRTSQRRRAAASVQAARLNHLNDIRLTDLQTLQLWESLKGAELIERAQKASLAAAEEALKGTRAAQKTGLSTTLEVLDAMETKLSTELSLIASEHDRRNNELILARLMGYSIDPPAISMPSKDAQVQETGKDKKTVTQPQDAPLKLEIKP